MKALVTGGTGFIGSHLVELLMDHGYTVRCLIRKTSDTKWLKGLNVEFTEGGLFDHNSLRAAVSGVDLIFHSAGVTKAKKKEEYFSGNADGTKNLLKAVRDANPQLKRFIHISSQTAVGPSQTKTPITEDVIAQPITTYGESKWKAEKECHAMMEDLPITIVRPPAVFGPRDKDVFEYFNTMNKGLQASVGLHDKFVSLIHVTDLVRGFLLAGESEVATGKTYFIASSKVYNWKEIGEVTRRVLNRKTISLRIPEFGVYALAAVAEFMALFSSSPALINFEKARDMVQDFWTCDSSKAEQDFEFKQQISLEEGIRSTIEWYRTHGWLS